MDDSLLLQLQGLSLHPQDNKEQLSLKDVSDLWTEYFLDPDISIEILRAIRKLAATLDPSDKTKLFLDYDSLFVLSEKVLVDFMDSRDPEKILLLRISLQFLFNAFQGSNEIHRLKKFEAILSNLLSRSSDAKIQDYTSSLIYIGNKSSLFLKNDLINSLLITACIEYESNFALLAIKSFVEDNLLHMYNLTKKSEDRHALIEIIGSDSALSLTSAPTVSLLFKERSKQIMNANGVWSPDEAMEVTKLLDYLCDVSSNEKNLQDDKDLVIDVVHLLKMVHLLGKESTGNDARNPFVPIRKLSDVSEKDQKDASFGFKRDLIRLLGNLVYENEANQNLIGSLDGVQLLLDCSSIDGKNPFITQWVVFALRNVTQGNSKNQEIIAEMERSGKLDRRLLVESGIILS